jgi:hypothetical protein
VVLLLLLSVAADDAQGGLFLEGGGAKFTQKGSEGKAARVGVRAQGSRLQRNESISQGSDCLQRCALEGQQEPDSCRWLLYLPPPRPRLGSGPAAASTSSSKFFASRRARLRWLLVGLSLWMHGADRSIERTEIEIGGGGGRDVPGVGMQ